MSRFCLGFLAAMLVTPQVVARPPQPSEPVTRRTVESALAVGDAERALVATTALLSRHPGSWSCHRLRARVWRTLAPGGLEGLVETIRAEPPTSDREAELGAALFGLDRSAALAAFDRAVARDPRQPVALQSRLAVALESDGAEPLADAIREVGEGEFDPALDFYRAELARRRGDPEESLQLAKRAAAANPNDPFSRLLMVELLLELGRLADAEEPLTKATYLAATEPKTAAVRVSAELAHDRPERAIEIAEAALTRHPENEELRIRAAESLIASGRHGEAWTLLAPLRPSAPIRWGAWAARAAWGLRDPHKLATALREWHDDSPDRALHEGYVAYLRGDRVALELAIPRVDDAGRDALTPLAEVLRQREAKREEARRFNFLLAGLIGVCLVVLLVLILKSRSHRRS